MAGAQFSDFAEKSRIAGAISGFKLETAKKMALGGQFL
jgi:hypothetical protein